MSGLFVVFEGFEAVGKSYLIRTVERALREAGYNVCVTGQPGGTPAAELLRSIVKKEFEGEEFSEVSEALIMLASRNHLMDVLIEPELSKGTIVLCDRHDMSTDHYQGDMFPELRRVVSLQADLTVVIHRPFEYCQKDMVKRGDACRIENKLETYLRTVHQRYGDFVNNPTDKYGNAITWQFSEFDSDEYRAMLDGTVSTILQKAEEVKATCSPSQWEKAVFKYEGINVILRVDSNTELPQYRRPSRKVLDTKEKAIEYFTSVLGHSDFIITNLK